MKKILTFIVSCFSLALLLMVAASQPLNVSAATDKEASLSFTEEGGQFIAFDDEKGSYKNTAVVNVKIEGKEDELSTIIIEFDKNLTLVKVEGAGDAYFTKDGEVQIATTKNEFSLVFETAEVYGTALTGKVVEFSVANEKVEADETFCFVRGLYGDVNADGKINLKDYTAVKQLLLGNPVKVNGYVADVKGLADVNHDGYVNVNDYSELFHAVSAAYEAGKSAVEVETYSEDVYCTLLVKQEGAEDKYVAVKYGDKFNGQVVTGNDTVVVEEEKAEEYKVSYFFSTDAISTPIVDYVEAGTEVELIIANGTQLLQGAIQWYQYVEGAKGDKLVKFFNNTVMPEQDIVLYARYTNEYNPSLIYNVKVGDKYDQKAVEYKFFDVITEAMIDSVVPSDFTSYDPEGFEFGGWYFDAELTVEAAEIKELLEDTHLYAKYQPKTYNLFVKDSEGNTIDTLKVKYTYSIDLEEVTYPGFIFKGWFADQECTEEFDLETMPAKDLTVYGKFYDVVKEFVDNSNAVAEELGIENVVKGEYDNLFATKDVVYTINIAEISLDSIDLSQVTAVNVVEFFEDNADFIVELINDYIKHAADNYNQDVVKSLAINGYVVYKNGIISNSGLVNAVKSVAEGIIEDFENANIKDVVVTLNGGTEFARDITVKTVVEGTNEELKEIYDQVKEYTEILVKYVEVISGEYESVVEVVLPEEVMEIVEDLVKEYLDEDVKGFDLIEVLNDIEIRSFLEALAEYEEGLEFDAETQEALDKIYGAFWAAVVAVEDSELIESLKVTIDGVEFKLEEGSFENVGEFLDALLAEGSPIEGLLNKTLGDLFQENGYYELALGVELVLSDKAPLEEKELKHDVFVRVFLYEKEFDMVFEANGGELTIGNDNVEVNGNVVTGMYNVALDVTAEKEGYTFVGWYDNAKLEGEPVEPLKVVWGGATYYAKYEIIEYYVFYELNDDAKDAVSNIKKLVGSFNVETLAKAGGAIELVAAERPHYTFLGWFSDAALTKQVTEITKLEDIQLYAKWEAKQYEITYLFGGSDTLGTNFGPYKYLTTVDLDEEVLQWVTYEVEGHYCVGYEWKYADAKDEEWADLDESHEFVMDGNIVIRPKEEAYKVQLSLDVNTKDKSATVADDEVFVKYATSFDKVAFDKDGAYNNELPTPVRPGFVFLGWFLNEEGTVALPEKVENAPFLGYAKPDSDLFDGEIVLYAAWAELFEHAYDKVIEGIHNTSDNSLVPAETKDRWTAVADADGNFFLEGVTVEVDVENILTNSVKFTAFDLNALIDEIMEYVDANGNNITALTINGYKVVAANAANNEEIANCVAAYVNDLLATRLTADKVAPSIEVYGKFSDGDERTLVVDFVAEAGTPQHVFDDANALIDEWVEKVYEIVDFLEDGVEIKLPAELVKELEKYASDQKLTLSEAIAEFTLEELLDLIAENIDENDVELLKEALEFAYENAETINTVLNNGFLSLDLLEGDYAPADSTLAAAVEAIKAMLTLDLTQSVANFEDKAYEDGVRYVLEANVKVDVNEIAGADAAFVKSFNISLVIVQNEYTVTFVGAEGVIATKAAFVGEYVQLDKAPVKAGYYHAGWELDGKEYAMGENAAVQVKADDIVVDAVFAKNKFAVVFDANTGAGTMAKQEFIYDVEAKLTKNAFTKVGYTFVGWNTKADGTGTTYADEASVKNLATMGEVKLYAQWAANDYTLTFVAGYKDGTTTYVGTVDGAESKSVAVKYNGKVTVKGFDVKCVGHDFVKWTVTNAEGAVLEITDGMTVAEIVEFAGAKANGEIKVVATYKGAIYSYTYWLGTRKITIRNPKLTAYNMKLNILAACSHDDAATKVQVGTYNEANTLVFVTYNINDPVLTEWVMTEDIVIKFQ